jgi:hypothetical protein
MTGATCAPFGIEVVQVAPSSLAMTFESSAVKEVTISPAVEEPAEGFEVRRVTADPAGIVAGPAAVRATKEAITEPVSVAGAANTVTEVVNVGVADPAVRLRSAQSVRVTVIIGPRGGPH